MLKTEVYLDKDNYFENYTFILTNLNIKDFNKKVINKSEYEAIEVLMNTSNIEQVAKTMQIEKYKYCYDIQEDIFYNIEDLK